MYVAIAGVLAVSVAGCISHQEVVRETHADEISRTAVHSRPAVSEQSRSLRESESPYRTVVPGDTLYSIAWEAGHDYREIAAWNHIPRPYTIKPGQQLRVRPPPKSETRSENSPPTPSGKRDAVAAGTDHKPATVRKASRAVPVPAHVAPPAAKAGQRTGDRKAGAKPANHEKSNRNDKLASAHVRNVAPASKPEKKTSSMPPGFWAWPADGRVLGRSSEGDAKGLDIGGTRGEPVRAAAGGRVVYQGSGLRGYGQLIIVKHNDEFLSAYAHNDRIYVKEGDVVKRGQKIADMGSSGSDRVKLHFEIRRQGVPIDPLKYLPKR